MLKLHFKKTPLLASLGTRCPKQAHHTKNFIKLIFFQKNATKCRNFVAILNFFELFLTKTKNKTKKIFFFLFVLKNGWAYLGTRRLIDKNQQNFYTARSFLTLSTSI